MILSYRISVKLLESDESFDELLKLLTTYRSAVDEISLFTEYWHHGYYPLERFAELADLLGRRIGQLRKARFRSVGINMLDTIGHLNEAWDFLPPLPFPPMVGHDGSVSRGCFCPNSPEFRGCIKKKYELIAKAGPDFIWVDDDIRMHHHGVAWGCFCPACLKQFDQGAFGREELIARLNATDGGELRAAWVEHNASVLDSVLADIEPAVHKVDPEIELGLMTCGPGWTTYSGQALERWHRTLKASRSRPGGGFYDDAAPRGMISKALEVGRACVPLPPEVTNVQYELENFPYQKLDKSVRTVMNECTLALATGCNGIAFNALKDLPGSMEDYHDLMKAIAAERSRWERFLDATSGCAMAGIWPAHDDRLMAKRQVRNGNWFDLDLAYQPNVSTLAEIGLPLALRREHACAVVLGGSLADTFSDDDLREILSGGVLLDGKSLTALWERGLGELTGVRIGRTFDNGVYERFTDHPANGRFAGDARDVRLSFWGDLAYELVPLDETVGEAARLVGYDGSDCGACISTFTNSLGGRVAVLGYGPWTRLGSGAKRSQMLAITDWLSQGRLPMVIDKTLRVTPFVRTSADGKRFAAVLINTAFDPTGPFHLRVRGIMDEVVSITADGDERLTTRKEKGETRIAVKNVEPWSCMLLTGCSG